MKGLISSGIEIMGLGDSFFVQQHAAASAQARALFPAPKYTLPEVEPENPVEPPSADELAAMVNRATEGVVAKGTDELRERLSRAARGSAATQWGVTH